MKNKIALIVGHARDSQGNVRKGISEFRFWSAFMEEFMENLPEYTNLEVRLFYRPDQKKIGYFEAMRRLHGEIDEWGADVDIEMHFNGATVVANGHEVIYSGSQVSKELAEMLNESFNKYLTNRDRGVKRVVVRGAFGLKVGKSASIISEAFFGRNVLDYMGGTGRENLRRVYLDFLDKLSSL